MKYLKTMAVAAGLACTAVSSQATLEIDFASTPFSQIAFTSTGAFSFSNTKGHDELEINNSSSLAQDSIGDFGNINGTFQIGAEIGTSGNYVVTDTTAGQMTIKDGSGFTYTGNLVWDTIGTGGTTPGTGGTLNLNGTLNLTSVSYGGTQLDLQALLAAGLAKEIVTFQFGTASTVPQLFNTTDKSFSGSIFASSVPEPTTVVAGALLLLPFGLSAFRAFRKDKSGTTVV